MARSRGRDPFADWFGELSDPLRDDKWQPAVDIYETEQAVVVRVDLAGVRSSDLAVTVDGELLHVRGVRRARLEPDVRRLHQMEIPCGPFERTIRITIPFERDHVTANLEEGFLRITLPKRGPRRRNIDVSR